MRPASASTRRHSPRPGCERHSRRQEVLPEARLATREAREATPASLASQLATRRRVIGQARGIGRSRPATPRDAPPPMRAWNTELEPEKKQAVLLTREPRGAKRCSK